MPKTLGIYTPPGECFALCKHMASGHTIDLTLLEMSTGVNTPELSRYIGILINFPGPHSPIPLEGEIGSPPLHPGHEIKYRCPSPSWDIATNTCP